MFCLYTLPLARPAQAKIQLLAAICSIVAPSILHFKGFGMRNLQYQIRICQKSHNTVTIAVYVWTVVRIFNLPDVTTTN